jgi:hypothetical protein
VTQQEWLERYKRQFVAIAGVTPAQAEVFADEPFEQISEFFEDDPEGAADEEMSCWEAE